MSYAWGDPGRGSAHWFEPATPVDVPTPDEAAERPEQTIRRLATEVGRMHPVVTAARKYVHAAHEGDPTGDAWIELLDALDALGGE